MTRAEAVREFAAGAVATLFVHQPLLALLHGIGASPWPGFDLAPTAPLGAPRLVSAVFWGGVWGALLAAPLRRAATERGRGWLRAFALGALLPNAVGAALMVMGHGRIAPAYSVPAAIACAVLVNGVWATAVAALVRVTGAFAAPSGAPS